MKTRFMIMANFCISIVFTMFKSCINLAMLDFLTYNDLIYNFLTCIVTWAFTNNMAFVI